MYLPAGLQGQAPQLYRGAYTPYGVDDLTAAAAALNLGGQPLGSENLGIFQQAGAPPRQTQVKLKACSLMICTFKMSPASFAWDVHQLPVGILD